ncbi:hypothetical protein F4820DRAFT_409178 [Hypoxylon rubiginosum]|uniref:Uncharacterized protein n=1 Tax=Hypoxylon rubiginosum TaxID=110542 RepID=A0ACB9ZCB4_9PEZI|nr:hypothetical protein F4820DRAFT_409178 [Hypoxylon rubiginosum]
MLKKLFPIAAFAFTASAMNETIEGYKYFLSGPKTDLPKSQYEHDAANTAMSILEGRLGNEPLPSLPGDNVTAVLELKEYLGSDKLKELLEPDVDQADANWYDIIKASGDGWNSSDARGVIFLPNVSAQVFGLWYASPNADAANLAANPEHYAKDTVQTSTGLASRILEGWHGITTNFTIPNFTTPNRTADPFLRPLPDFPIQQAGDKVLRDGTRFGMLHISLRDVNGSDYGQPNNGFEIYASVWYQDGVPEEYLEQESRHEVIEIVNLTLQCQKDIESGNFTVTPA